MAGLEKFGRLVTHSPSRYLASFKSFLAAFEISTEDYYLSIGSKVPDSLQCEEKADVRVLGIGSGSGDADSVILKKVLLRHNSVYNRVVEPSEEMIERFKALVRKDTSLARVKFDWRQQTAEEYFQTADSTKFHIVHAVHVLYNVEDPHATLRDMWEQLEDGGYVLVVMQPDQSAWGKLQNKLWENFGHGDRLNTSFRSSGDVRKWLDARGIKYVTSEDEVNINATECFQEGSEKGMQLLDFLTKTPYVLKEPEIKSMVLEYIRQNSSVVDNKILFKSVNEAIVAFKTGAYKK